MKKEIKNLEFKNYYLREFQLYDGECDITFNIVAIDTSKEEITVAVTNRGRISVVEFDLFQDSNGDFYFSYGCERTRIKIEDFED